MPRRREGGERPPVRQVEEVLQVVVDLSGAISGSDFGIGAELVEGGETSAGKPQIKL